jgi:Domain of unknown function (DUF4157)
VGTTKFPTDVYGTGRGRHIMAATVRVQPVQGEQRGASRARGRAPSARSAGGTAGSSVVVRDVAAFILGGQRPGARSAPAASGSEIGDVMRSSDAPLRRPLRAEREARLGADRGHEQAERPAAQRSPVHDVLRGSGQPLDDSTRTDMESRLGADFSDVRVHDGTAARTSAAALGARAYTSGHHVVIGEGGGDKHTLAHELTHVIQQRQGPVSGTDNGSGLSVSDPSDRFEREAETNARRAMSKPQPVQRSMAQAAHANRSVTKLPVQRMPKRKNETPEKQSGKKAGTNEGKGGGQDRQEDWPQVKEGLIAALKPMGWEQHGAGQSLTLHLPGEENKKSEENKTTSGRPNRKQEIYKDSQNIREPKSYSDNRTMQSMRWISTLAKNYLNAEEVQATVIDNTMYISANQNKHNKLLRELAGKHNTGKAFAKALVDDRGKPETDATGRLTRHARKLEEQVANAPDDDTGYYAEIASMSVKVPDDVSKDDDGLHAERRLSKLPGFAPEKTIGVKRPCVVCYSELYAVVNAGLDKGNLVVYPGPLWPSKAANKGMPGEQKTVAEYAEYLHETVKEAGGTYISFTKDEKYSWDYNTDSDTD